MQHVEQMQRTDTQESTEKTILSPSTPKGVKKKKEAKKKKKMGFINSFRNYEHNAVVSQI